MRKLKLIKAFCEAFDEEMQRDERVCLFGEDVGEYGGVFGTSQKLQSKYGQRRVFDTPLSECAILGTAVGSAMTGLRPIAELMYMDFVTVAMDPLINQCAKLRFMSNGQFSLPLVVFAQFGSGTSEAAQHSQSLEAWFMHTPGLKVVMPSTVYDAKGLMKSSIRDDDPVIFLWHRMMYGLVEEVPEETWTVPLGQAVVRRAGEDVTIVATSNMVPKAIEAGESLADDVSVEVIDPRTIVPLDIDTILTSVAKTGRLLVVHEANTCGGFGAELVRQVVEKCYDELVCAPKVLGQIGVPMPFSPILEQACLPQVQDIAAAVEQMFHSQKTTRA